MKKKEIIFISSILAFALILWIGLSVLHKGEYASIEITVGGEKYGTYSLDHDQTIKINDTNVCEIKDGKAYMIQAECPDHLCMKQKPIDKNGGTIICLPNKVIIEGNASASKDTDQPSVDAIS
ncbi:MAG: NusG domain II-containing protein [Clostridia bacterium]|nr:NusG domain II-containing protein [Clostridia bacterium]MDY5556023.1 NusG domain II-containing protein [Blautia sp.]